MQSSSNEQLNEIKTQLITREGVYRLMPHAEYSRPKTSSYAPNSAIGGAGGAAGSGANSTHVRISFTKVCTPDHPTSNNNANPFLPTTYYTPRMSHSNEGLNHIGGGNSTPPSAPSSNVATNTNQNNSSNAYHHLNHHMNNDLMNDHSQHMQHSSNNTSNNTGNTNNSDNVRIDERICFNIGREIFIYAFNGLQPADLTKLVDRRSYKQTSPTCHDICSNLEIRVAQLLVGFNAGQIQMIDLYRGEVNKFYNQERFIEKSKVTCIRWLPRSKSNFLVAYATGQMYLYKEDLTCGTAAPNYQQFKSGEGFTIYTCKTKSSRNPIFRWSIGEGAIHEFAFSPCGEFLAVVSQDGFLRVFHYDRMELVGRMRSYFGGLLCVGWSPDSRFIVTGGEDDLITVWSHTEKRVIARGQGHKSWVNVVTFDPYMTTYNADSIDDFDDIMDDDHSFEDGGVANHHHPHRNYLRNMRQTTRPPHHDSSQVLHKNNVVNNNKSDEFNITSYRIGSVGQDTQLCLWDLTDDVIRQSSQQPVKSRTSLVNTSTTSTNNLSNSVQTLEQSPAESAKHHHQSNGLLSNASNQTTSNHNNHSNHHHHNSAHQFFNSLIKSSSKSSSEHKHHKTFSLSSRSFSDKHAVKSASSNASNNTNSTTSSGQGTLTSCTGSLGSSHHQSHHNSNNSSVCDPGRLLGTMLCPRLDDVPMLEPHVCKKVAYERLTSLVFRKDYFVIANQDGKISIYARPNKLTTNLKLSSQNASMASDVNDIACDDNSSAIV